MTKYCGSIINRDEKMFIILTLVTRVSSAFFSFNIVSQFVLLNQKVIYNTFGPINAKEQWYSKDIYSLLIQV